MNITSAVFTKGVVDLEGLPRDLRTHVAFIGRSNVGKSSFINSLVQQKSLCRSSSTPGRTTEANLFLINNKYYFVDLPGYGYAKQPQAMRHEIEALIQWYLTEDLIPLAAVVLLVDAKVGVTATDREMIQLLQEETGVEVLIVANKVDKLKQKDHKTSLHKIQEVVPHSTVLPYSALKNQGREKVLEWLDRVVK